MEAPADEDEELPDEPDDPELEPVLEAVDEPEPEAVEVPSDAREMTELLCADALAKIPDCAPLTADELPAMPVAVPTNVAFALVMFAAVVAMAPAGTR